MLPFLYDIYVQKRNYFINMEFLEGVLLELMSNISRTIIKNNHKYTLRTITNIARSVHSMAT